MRIVFIGPPGAGKGTQSARLVEYLNVPHLLTGDMLRHAIQEKSDVGLRSQKYLAQGKLVPDDVILEVVGQRLRQAECRNGCLLDGFPRTQGQAAGLDELLDQHGTPISAVLELKVDQPELVRRLVGRAREDDRPSIIRKRLEQYERQTAPLVEYYRRRGLLHSIDGLGSPDEVFNRIKTVLEQIAAKTT